MFRWLTQPGKNARASRFIERVERGEEFTQIYFKEIPEKPFFYPASCSWIDFCQTVDESFQPANWHFFTDGPMELTTDDIVADCGAAEGLFSFVAAQQAKKVYAIEPVPKWLPALNKTFCGMSNVAVLPVALGHRQCSLRMTDDEIYSRVSPTGALEIQVETLDALFHDKGVPLTFIKADVEGYEFQLLLGAAETIRQNHPRLSLTVYHDQNHFVEIADFLRQIHSDYRISFRGIAANGNPVLLQAY